MPAYPRWRTACQIICVAPILHAGARAAWAATYVVESDARPRIDNSRVVTDAYDDTTSAFQTNVKHFAYQLGKVAGSPYFTSSPGFNATSVSGLPAGELLGFDVARRLVSWNGSNGPVHFGPTANAETLRLKFGAATTTVDDATDQASGFDFAIIGDDGSLHKHLNATLLNGTTAAPAQGLYFFCLRLRTTSSAVTHSDALYIAYNNGLSSTAFARGMSYLTNPYAGDANFDSNVNFDDLIVLAQHYGSTGDSSYFDGDFNGDRNVNFDDLVTLAQHYDTSAPASPLADFSQGFAADWALAQSLVPEPTALSGGVVALSALKRRRPKS